MIHTLYIEEQIANHPKTLSIQARLPHARAIYCERYTEVFNRHAQDFRLQKSAPALILARKEGRLVLPTPEGLGLPGFSNYYFSHFLNCIYDCRYCFLQGMYRSAHYVLFVNFEDFFAEIRKISQQNAPRRSFFFSGYDGDSLALDDLTGFANDALHFFQPLELAEMELRTKSIQLKSLSARRALKNVVVAYSLNPASIAAKWENGTPAPLRRIQAAAELGKLGWPIGLRLDPLIADNNFETEYGELFTQIAEHLDPSWIHSVTLGPLRFPRAMFDKIIDLYPEESLLAGPLELRAGIMSYSTQWRQTAEGFCRHFFSNWLSAEKVFTCHTLEGIDLEAS